MVKQPAHNGYILVQFQAGPHFMTIKSKSKISAPWNRFGYFPEHTGIDDDSLDDLQDMFNKPVQSNQSKIKMTSKFEVGDRVTFSGVPIGNYWRNKCTTGVGIVMGFRKDKKIKVMWHGYNEPKYYKSIDLRKK